MYNSIKIGPNTVHRYVLDKHSILKIVEVEPNVDTVGRTKKKNMISHLKDKAIGMC